MKRLSITAIILSAILLALLSCAKNGQEGAETNTAKPAEPSHSTFPASGKLGNLIGGEIFPEPAKYLVLKGEGDLYYIYDRMGEFRSVCKGMGYLSGFYGEDGIVGNFSLRLMQNMDDWQTFGPLMLHIVDGELIEFLDCYTDKTVQVKSKGLSIGEFGGVLPFDDRYLVIEAYYDENAENGREFRYARCTWLDQNGELAGEFDPASFGRIRGVYGGKYIIAVPRYMAREDEHFNMTIHSLSGEVLLTNIEAAGAAVFYMMQEGEVIDDPVFDRRLIIADHAYTENERWYDRELEPMSVPPQDAYELDCVRMHNSIELEDRFVIGDNSVIGHSSFFWTETTPEPIRIYVGIKDGEGNWLFKIFNPALANDSKRRPISVFGLG